MMAVVVRKYILEVLVVAAQRVTASIQQVVVMAALVKSTLLPGLLLIMLAEAVAVIM